MDLSWHERELDPGAYIVPGSPRVIGVRPGVGVGLRWQAFVGIVLAAVLDVMILAMGSGGAAAQDQGAQRPNFVVIMTDDQTAPSLRVMNSVKRELIDRGTVFPNFFDDPSIGRDRDIVLENRVSDAVRTPDFMYAEHDVDRDLAPDEYELYDLEADPHQLRNRYGDPGFGSITSQLEQRLDQLRDCAGASCR